MTVKSDKIVKAFNKSRATGVVAFDTSKSFYRVWHAGLVLKRMSCGISGQVFGLIRVVGVVLDGKSSQEYSINAGLPERSLLGATLLLHINDLPDDVIGNFFIYADDTTLYWKCGQASNLCLELAYKLESDLRGTVDWNRKCLIGFDAGKTCFA